ncbi:MAG: hypothetical protein AAGI49_07820 [Bacteroidota bacterium]
MEQALFFETGGTGGVIGMFKGSKQLMNLRRTNPNAFKKSLSRINWGNYLENTLGVKKPTSNVALHAHHIVAKIGNKKAAPFAEKSREILEKHNINPYFDKDNLVWSPSKNVHGAKQQELIYDTLKKADDSGADESMIRQVLRELGEKAAAGDL